MGKRTKTQPTKESLVIAAAIQAANITKASIAAQMGVEPSFVSMWSTARRPVPADKAEKLAQLLGLKPAEVSAAYAKVAGGGSRVGEPSAGYGEALRPDLEIARLQNDVHALSLALASLVVAMTAHRPAEAKDVAAALRRSVPRKFRDQGLVHELLTTLDQA